MARTIETPSGAPDAEIVHMTRVLTIPGSGLTHPTDLALLHSWHAAADGGLVHAWRSILHELVSTTHTGGARAVVSRGTIAGVP